MISSLVYVEICTCAVHGLSFRRFLRRFITTRIPTCLPLMLWILDFLSCESIQLISDKIVLSPFYDLIGAGRILQ